MSFKFFRKHQKTMLWIIVIITIFTFSLFSVTSTLRTCFRQQATVTSLGLFTSQDGSEVEITERDYASAENLIRGFFGMLKKDGLQDKDIYTHIIMRHEAMKAGIRVSDQEISQTLKANGVRGSKEDYFNWVKRGTSFKSVAEFEKNLRELILVNKYRAFLSLTENLVSSEDLYEEFKLENEEFKLEYAAFPYGDFATDLSADSVSQEDLAAWYEELRDSSNEVREQFSEAEKFEFDVAYLDLREAVYGDYADRIETMGIEIQDREINERYNLVKDERYVIEPPEGEPPAEEAVEEAATEQDTEEEMPAEGEEETDVEENPVQYIPEADVREELEKEVKLAKYVEKVCMEWVDYTREKGLIGKTMEEWKKEQEEKDAKEPESGDDEVDEGGKDGGAVAEKAAEDPLAFYASLIEKYGLKTDRIEGPVSLDDLDKVPTYGSEMFKTRARFLKQNTARYMGPEWDHPDLAFFCSVTELVPRRKKGLDEVADAAMEEYIKQQRKLAAEKATKEFMEQLKSKTREMEEVKTTIAQWEIDARQKAADSVAAEEGITDEDMAQRIKAAEEREIARLQPEIDALLERHYYNFFDETATDMGIDVEIIDYFSKAEVRKPEFYQQENSPRKFVQGNRRIFDLDTNGITDPLNDREGDAWYLVRVLDRRFPPASTLTEEDYESTKRAIQQRRMMELRYPQMRQQQPQEEKKDPFAWEAIMENYNLRLRQRSEKAEGTEATEQSKKQGN
ncbi:MAG: hypothetical protein KJ645_00590 [Planctomycetes bacterium]|nr:hypothetical protein [Planctomycetota bacterium]